MPAAVLTRPLDSCREAAQIQSGWLWASTWWAWPAGKVSPHGWTVRSRWPPSWRKAPALGRRFSATQIKTNTV